MSVEILTGDCRKLLQSLKSNSVHCVVTSPPYWGLRDYGIPPSIWGGVASCEHMWDEPIISQKNDSNRGNMEWTTGGNPGAKVKGERVSQGAFCRHCGAWYGAFGLEPTIQLYIEHTIEIFREVRRVLRNDGTCWINIGDGFQNKQLLGIPWRVAFALQDDGYYLRQDIIWSKPNPMPESVTDRCTKAHEYLFLMTKSAKYYYDADAIRETGEGYGRGKGLDAFRSKKYQNNNSFENSALTSASGAHGHSHEGGRNKRSVWEIPSEAFPEAHFATFPQKLVIPCIKAGCPSGGTVLDPFAGSGTVGVVASKLCCNAILMELNPKYVEMIKKRINRGNKLFSSVPYAPR
jgi:DNA modification methylase